MDTSEILFVSAVTVTGCTLAAAFLLLWLWRRRRREEAVQKTAGEPLPAGFLGRWRFFIIAWPLFCLFLAGLFLWQCSQGMEGRDPAHLGFTVIPLIFFFIGMKMRYSTAKKCTYCTVFVPGAKVVSLTPHYGRGHHTHTPVYEYSVGGETYRVSSRDSYSPCPVSSGQEVELYCSPANRRYIYVPAEERCRGKWSLLLCGVGVLFPLAALAAPWLLLLLPEGA